MEIEKISVYKEYLATREEILKHKWYESEKAGYDIGFAKAVIDWTMRFKTAWIKARQALPTPTPCC